MEELWVEIRRPNAGTILLQCYAGESPEELGPAFIKILSRRSNIPAEEWTWERVVRSPYHGSTSYQATESIEQWVASLRNV